MFTAAMTVWAHKHFAMCGSLNWLHGSHILAAYSAVLKRSVCHSCILFPQPVVQKVQGTFIIQTQHFNDAATEHSKRGGHEDASNFLLTGEGVKWTKLKLFTGAMEGKSTQTAP